MLAPSRRRLVIFPLHGPTVSRPVLRGVASALLALALCVALGAGEARAQSVWVGYDKVLRVNGDRFFPVGLLDLGVERFPDDWNDRIRESGANVVWDLGFAYSESLATCSAIRDSAEATGYYLMTGSPDTWEWDDPATPEYEVDNPMYQADSLSALDSCFPDQSVHLAYANRDEPVWTISRGQVGDIDSAHVWSTYSQIKDEDEHRPIGMNFAPAHLSKDLETWKDDIRGYVGATDVVMFASYPYPPGPGTCTDYNVVGWPECAMDRLPIGADMFIDELNEPGQPLWMIIQAHKAIPLKESRWTAAQSVIHGATGILWAGWTWWHPGGNGHDNWEVTRQVISEYASLAAVLAWPRLGGLSVDAPDVDVAGKAHYSDDPLVLAASRNGYVGPATITLPPYANGLWAEVLFEGRFLPIENRQFTDTFDSYESHIYRIRPDEDAPTGVGVLAAGGEALAIRVFPNPAWGGVRATFAAPAARTVEFSVYDVGGRLVAGGISASRTAPTAGEIVWDARDADGLRVPAGIYFLRGVDSSGGSATARVVLR